MINQTRGVDVGSFISVESREFALRTSEHCGRGKADGRLTQEMPKSSMPCNVGNPALRPSSPSASRTRAALVAVARISVPLSASPAGLAARLRWDLEAHFCAPLADRIERMPFAVAGALPAIFMLRSVRAGRNSSRTKIPDSFMNAFALVSAAFAFAFAE